MECFFGTHPLPRPNLLGKEAVVGFHIPAIGIRFKAPFSGVSGDHCDLASLLALLEFIDTNQKYFGKHTFQIYGTNLHVINQLNGREPISEMLKPLLDKAQDYRFKYRYSLDWVPDQDNSALNQLLD